MLNSSHNNYNNHGYCCPNSYSKARLNSDFQVFSQAVDSSKRSIESDFSDTHGINSNDLSSRQRLIEKVILSVFLSFIALGIVAGILALTMLNIVNISVPIFIVSGVLLVSGLLGLGIFAIYRVSCASRKALAKMKSEDEEFHLKYRLLSEQELVNFYSKIVDLEDIELRRLSNKLAKAFYYNNQSFNGDLQYFLSNLYLETYYLLHKVFPEETEDNINQRVIDFLKPLVASQKKEDQINFLNSVIGDNILGLELSSLLGSNSKFSSGALSYVLENILVRGINSSKKEEFKSILVGLGSRILSFWTLSNWEGLAIPYSLKIVLLSAMQDSYLSRKIMSNLSNTNMTLWQSILRSENKQAIEIFLFEYGILNCNENGDSALMVAVQEGVDISLVAFLLDKGCDVLVESRNNKGLDILDLMPTYLEKYSKDKLRSLLKIIVEKSLSVREMTNEFQFKILVTSLKLDLGLTFLKELVQLKINLWAYSNSTETLYSFSLSHDCFNVAKWCLENSKPEFSELIANMINNKSLLISFLDSPNFDEDLFKLMLFHGLSLNLPITENGGNILSYLAIKGKLEILIHLLQLFVFDEEEKPFDEEQNKLKQKLEVAINSLDFQGNSLLHYLGSSLSLDLSSNLIEDFLVLLMTSYNFNKLDAVNNDRRSILVNAMINKKFTLASLLLNFMSPSDINAGAKGISIHEHSHPFFLWMMYYFEMPRTEAMIEKMIRKGLNLNLLLTPANKTIKDICIEWNLLKIISFLKKINVWNSMLLRKEL